MTERLIFLVHPLTIFFAYHRYSTSYCLCENTNHPLKFFFLIPTKIPLWCPQTSQLRSFRCYILCLYHPFFVNSILSKDWCTIGYVHVKTTILRCLGSCAQVTIWVGCHGSLHIQYTENTIATTKERFVGWCTTSGHAVRDQSAAVALFEQSTAKT